MEIRDLLLDTGSIPFPNIHRVEEKLGPEIAYLSKAMWSALWHNYLVHESPINTTSWYEKFPDYQTFNAVLRSLCNLGWVVSTADPARNWAEAIINRDHLLSFITEDEWNQLRANFKFSKYRMRKKSAQKSDLVKVNGTIQRTGLNREGFCKAGNTVFEYDVDKLNEYLPYVQLNLTKSMDKMRMSNTEMQANIADYDAVSIDILDYHATRNRQFSRGECVADSRGRAISSALSKVFNPIGFKDARALLVIPEAELSI